MTTDVTRASDHHQQFHLPEINTWRLCNKQVSADLVMQMVQQWETQGYRFGCVCVDDGWQEDGLMGVWNPDTKRFPSPQALTTMLHDRGYAVRVWAAPCQIHPGTPIFEKAWPDALMKNKAGKPSSYTGLGTYTLDIRHELARDHVRDVIIKMAKEWACDAFKIDFPPFYEPDDAFYQQRDYDLPEDDKMSMVANFYAIVREAVDRVRPGIRIESYPKCYGAADYLDDCIAGDLVGSDRSLPVLSDYANKLRNFIGDRPIVPWFEMVWGEGGDAPNDSESWHAGFLEYIAASINFGFKIEHSFLPFDYPNANQIRALNNLYGPCNKQIKVLVAGRKMYTVAEMLACDISLSYETRFLVAPQSNLTALLHTAPLQTSAHNWHCRNVITGHPVTLRTRNEFWDGTTKGCRVQFEAKAGEVYELWHEGEPTQYFSELLSQHKQGGH